MLNMHQKSIFPFFEISIKFFHLNTVSNTTQSKW